MLVLTPLVIAWTYVAIALIKQDWNWVPTPDAGGSKIVEICVYCGLIGLIIGLAALMAAIIYWNARLWMLHFVLRAIGSLPFLSEVAELTAEDPNGKWRWDAEIDEWYYDGIDGLPFFVAIPLAIIGSIIRFTLNLIIAIGIPVASPLILLIAMSYILDLVSNSHVALLGVGAVMFIGTVFMYIIHPILSFKHD